MNNTLIKCISSLFLLPVLSVAAEKPLDPVYLDPLSVYVRTAWPEDIKTVAQAVNYVLEPTGYRFVTAAPAPSDAVKFAGRSIPAEAKIYRTTPIIDALQLLVGQANYVIIDHNNRLVSFSSKPQ